jgi:TPR repeat protein
VAEDDTPADRPLSQDAAQRQRSRGEFGSLIFLAAVAIIAIPSAASLFAAGFVLLTHSRSALRPAAPSLVRDVPATAPANSRIAVVAPPPATPPAIAAPPRPLPPPAPKANPRSAAATFALAQGDANFGAGEVSVARFYYEQAVDGGDADASIRIGETFDPAFLRIERLRRSYADTEAARFWYERALALGVAEAKPRLAHLETEPAESGATPAARSERSRHRVATRRYDPHASGPASTFQELLERVFHQSP